MEYEDTEQERISVANYMSATIHVSWEGEYDASKKEPVRHTMPAPIIVQNLEIWQNDADGFFYSQDGILTAFEQMDGDAYKRLWIRRDKLKDFLAQESFCICWLCFAEKHFYHGINSDESEWTDWCGIFTEEEDGVAGEMTLAQKTY